MTLEQKQFFALLRSGLWGNSPDKILLGSVKWGVIHDMAKKQALLGIILDGVELLPEEFRPPRHLYLKWCVEVANIEDENHRLNKVAGDLFSKLRDENILPVMLKGQGIARNYRNPLHRQSGDIDFYTGKENHEKINRIILDMGGEWRVSWPFESVFALNGVVLENHRIVRTMACPTSNKRFKRRVEEWYKKGKTFEIELEGKKIDVPPVEFDIVYILYHAVHHLFSEGVGLRQICDWVTLLHNFRNKYDRNKVILFLKEIGMINAAKIFGCIAVHYLGLDKNELILPYDKKYEKYSQMLILDILDVGNFGQHGEDNHSNHKGTWNKRWYLFKQGVRRATLMRKTAPKEAFWFPYGLTEFFIKNTYFKLTKGKRY